MIHALANVRPILLKGALPAYRDAHIWARELFAQPREPEHQAAIPQKLHFIWIGSDLPEKYVPNLMTFVAANPMYEVNLWSDRRHRYVDSRVTQRNIRDGVLWLRDIFESEPNLGAKADIARYEIVQAEGGMYYDIDAFAVKPFDALFTRAWVPADLGTWNNLTNAMFGMPKDSRFLDYVMRCIRLNIYRGHREVPDRTGPTFFTTCYLAYGDPSITLIDQSIVNPLSPTAACVTVHECHHNWRER